MNTSLILGYGMYYGGALVFALILVAMLGAALAITNRYGRIMMPSVLPIIGLAIATSTILLNRSLRYIDVSPEGVNIGVQYTSTVGHYAAAGWSLRLMTLSVLAICAALILNYLFKQKKPPSIGLPLFLGFLAFFFTNTVTNSILGAKPVFVDNHYHPLLILTAAYMTRAESPEAVLKFAKYTILALLVGSVLMAFIRFDLVMQTPYVYGWIPGLQMRLWGLASHANSLGPLAVLYLILEIYQPFRRGWLRLGTVLLSLAVLVLAQSKTAYVMAVVLLGLAWLYRAAPQLQHAWRSGNPNNQVFAIAGVALLGALTLLGAMIFLDLATLLDDFLNSSAGRQLQSLTGRDLVWEVAIDTWKSYPLFGYGPSIWDPEFRKSIGMSFAFSAHNQYLQSLAGAGSIGLLGLSVYLGALFYYAFRLAKYTRGLSVLLGIFVFLRTTSETPLSSYTIFNADFLAHVMIFAYFIRKYYREGLLKLQGADSGQVSTPRMAAAS